MSTIVLDKLQQSFLITHLDMSGSLGGLVIQLDVTSSGFGSLVTNQFDQDVAVDAAVQRLGAQAQILGGRGQPPAAGEKLVRLLNPIGGKVAEKGLQQFIQVFAKRNLKFKW